MDADTPRLGGTNRIGAAARERARSGKAVRDTETGLRAGRILVTLSVQLSKRRQLATDETVPRARPCNHTRDSQRRLEHAGHVPRFDISARRFPYRYESSKLLARSVRRVHGALALISILQ